MPVAWITLGIADHSQITILTWVFSPGFLLSIHIPFGPAGFLEVLARVAFTALLINFVYYATLIYAGLTWVSRYY
jgi:hypothetical protein